MNTISWIWFYNFLSVLDLFQHFFFFWIFHQICLYTVFCCINYFTCIILHGVKIENIWITKIVNIMHTKSIIFYTNNIPNGKIEDIFMGKHFRFYSITNNNHCSLNGHNGLVLGTDWLATPILEKKIRKIGTPVMYFYILWPF